MIYNAGALNRKVKIFLPKKDVKDEYGLSTTKQDDYIIASAQIIQKKGRDLLNADAIMHTAEILIVVRYRQWINESCVVEYQKQKYDIKNVIDPYANHESLELYCTRRYEGDEYV